MAAAKAVLHRKNATGDPAGAASQHFYRFCPVCCAPLVEEKCKVVCRSASCVYRIVFNCSEY
jgi:hypothetical protein